jgi:hypothetical protein
MGVLDMFNPQKRFEKRLMKTKGEVLRAMLESKERFTYNQGLINAKALRFPQKAFTRTLAENAKWVQGVPEELEFFYKNVFPSLLGYSTSQIGISYFWNKVTGKTPRVHSGLPGLISRTMVNLIATPGFDATVATEEEVEEFIDGEAVTRMEDVTDQDNTDRLFDILEDNNFEDKLFPNAVIAESYGGYMGFKLSQDDDITEFPILEVAIPENVELITRRGRQEAIIFKTYFNEDDKDLELHEMYATDEDGNATISYKLFENENGKMREIKFTNEQAERYQEITMVGLDNIPALVKNNTTANTQFAGSIYGLSDYNNSQSIFNALDENLSQQMKVIRFNSPKRFFTNDMTATNSQGNKEPFDDFEMDYEMVDGDPDNQTNTYKDINSTFDITNYTGTDLTLATKALNNAGLSPKTVGMLNVEAINSSDESSRGKEVASLRTRDLKLKLWRKTLSELCIKILQFDDVVNKKREPLDYKVNINFNDYVVPSFEERINVAGNAINQGLMDIKEGVEAVYLDDKSDLEKKALVERLKIENGIPLTVAPEIVVTEEAPVVIPEEVINETIEEVEDDNTTTT